MNIYEYNDAKSDMANKIERVMWSWTDARDEGYQGTWRVVGGFVVAICASESFDYGRTIHVWTTEVVEKWHDDIVRTLAEKRKECSLRYPPEEYDTTGCVIDEESTWQNAQDETVTPVEVSDDTTCQDSSRLIRLAAIRKEIK